MGNQPARVRAAGEWHQGQLRRVRVEIQLEQIAICATLLQPCIAELCAALRSGQDYCSTSLIIENGTLQLCSSDASIAVPLESVRAPLLNSLIQF
jgi:hypothetical protein